MTVRFSASSGSVCPDHGPGRPWGAWFVTAESSGYAERMSAHPSPLSSGTLPLGAAERGAISEFAFWLRERFGSRVRELCLFGSRARSEAHEESDVDVLVSIVELTSSERREIARQSGDALTRWGVLLSPFAVSTTHLADLRARERRIAREIDRDAIPL